MPQVGFRLGNREVDFAEALAWAEEGTAPVPTEFLQALIHDRNDEFPSASAMGGCLRQFSLRKRVTWYSPITDGIAALFGTAMHKWLEQFVPAHVQGELRLRHTFEFDDLPAPYNRIEFGGTADYTDPTWDGGAGRIRDWKSKIYLPANFYIARAHKLQLNVYNALRRLNGLPTMRDWEVLYFDQKGHPQYLRGPMNDPDKVVRWLRKTLHQWAQAEATGALMPPVPEFFQTSPKTGQPISPCAYCNVRNECIRLWNEEQAHGSDGVTIGDSAAGSGGEAVADDGARA